MKIVVDRDVLHTGFGFVDDRGIIRIELPASERVLSELSDGKVVVISSPIGAMTFDLGGSRTAIRHARRCLRTVAGQGEPRVAGYERRGNIAGDRKAVSGLQEALVWAGFYDGLIDGDMGPRTRQAVRKFLIAVGSNPNAQLSSADLERLHNLAAVERRRAGFQYVRDEGAQVRIGIPTRWVSGDRASSRGTVYSSSDGSLKIDTLRFQLGGRTLQELFERISRRGPIKEITYVKSPEKGDFVVSGTDPDKGYYFRAVEASDGLYAFSAAYPLYRQRQLRPSIIMMATTFAPLSVLSATEPPSRAPETGSIEKTPPPPLTQPVKPVRSTGTGFVVNRQGFVLTNAHVVDGCASVTVALAGRSEVPARVVAVDRTIDLALLGTNLTIWAPPKFRTGVRMGERVSAFGFPLPGLLSTKGNFTTGTVTATAGLRDDTRRLQISAPVQKGNSGGPLFDGAGHVVGVIVAKLNVPEVHRNTNDMVQNVNFAIKSRLAIAFLEVHRVRIDRSTSRSRQQFALPDVAERAIRFTPQVRCR